MVTTRVSSKRENSGKGDNSDNRNDDNVDTYEQLHYNSKEDEQQQE
jgi:hypothetical protein